MSHGEVIAGRDSRDSVSNAHWWDAPSKRPHESMTRSAIRARKGGGAIKSVRPPGACQQAPTGLRRHEAGQRLVRREDDQVRLKR